MRSRDGGAVAVEFALLMPLLILILLGITDYGLWYSDSISLRSSAREGARMAVVEDYPPGCASGSPAQNTACTATDQASLIGGTPQARVYAAGAGGSQDWDEGNRLVVCTAIKEAGLTGFTPLPSDGVLRTRVSMRLEADQTGTSQVTGVDPGGDNWSWC